MESWANEKFFEISPCHFGITPYNALPLTRQMWITSQTARSVEEKKSWNLGVDSERGKRIIRHLATVSESRVALLFNNLSDNLCGHSKWHGFLTSSDEKWIPSLKEWTRNSLRSLILRASNLNWRVWSWLRLNAGGRPNTCKSSGSTESLLSGDERRTGE